MNIIGKAIHVIVADIDINTDEVGYNTENFLQIGARDSPRLTREGKVELCSVFCEFEIWSIRTWKIMQHIPLFYWSSL